MKLTPPTPSAIMPSAAKVMMFEMSALSTGVRSSC
jgi:hypothetical protein